MPGTIPGDMCCKIDKASGMLQPGLVYKTTQRNPWSMFTVDM